MPALLILSGCNSSDAYSLTREGRELQESGKTEQAEQRFRQAIAADPSYAESKLELGRLLEQREDFDGAQKLY